MAAAFKTERRDNFLLAAFVDILLFLLLNLRSYSLRRDGATPHWTHLSDWQGREPCKLGILATRRHQYKSQGRFVNTTYKDAVSNSLNITPISLTAAICAFNIEHGKHH
jgi:hypothetical protein